MKTGGDILKKIAFLFPGQGSQKVGMGQDLYQEMEQVKALFHTADDVSGLPITRLCFEGPMEELTQTVNLQPAVTVVNLALLEAVRKQGIQPDLCAGHSLGEYSALAAAGVISAEDCLKLVFKRGQLMNREATRHQGAMSAIVGLGIEQIEQIVSQAAQKGVVAVANHNSAEQIVITGSPEAVHNAGEIATAQGARSIPLKVSGAWHSPLIQDAEEEFITFLETIRFNPPLCPVVHNVTADTAHETEQIRRNMGRQLCSPVRWYDSMLKMVDQKVDVFVEIGPGRVLTGLLKKILPEANTARVYNVFDRKTLDKFIQAES
jgi:[acyl-carrier-protein] S-malonyltransferase